MAQSRTQVVGSILLGLGLILALSDVPGLLGVMPRLARGWLATVGLTLGVAGLALRLRAARSPQ